MILRRKDIGVNPYKTLMKKDVWFCLKYVMRYVEQIVANNYRYELTPSPLLVKNTNKGGKEGQDSI